MARARHFAIRPSLVARGLVASAGVGLFGILAAPTWDHVMAARFHSMPDVALQQQVRDEMIPEIGLPALLVLAERSAGWAPPHHEISLQALERAVALEPRNGESWARLAYARRVSSGNWDAPALAALRDSYLRLPYGEREFGRWRLQLADSAWEQLPSDVRAAVIREARIESLAWIRQNTAHIETDRD